MKRRGNTIYLTRDESRVMRSGLAALGHVYLKLDGQEVAFVEVSDVPAPAEKPHQPVSEK